MSTSRNSTSNLKKHLDRCHANTKLVERSAGSEKRKHTEDQVLPDRKTFAKELDKEYAIMEKELRKTIDAQDYVSTTADIWSANNKSFLGVTVHWIDADTLKRKKAAIACRRFRGRHTYDAIATELEDIFSQYGLTNDKVTACVTDNGSNFVKAFKEHQQRQVESDEEEDEVDGDGEADFTDLHSVLAAAKDDNAQDGLCVLPPHHRCAAHTLNLIANNEVDKWLSSNVESRAVYRSATAKCSALWTKASRSTVASEFLEEVSGRKLIVPTLHWTSYSSHGKILAMKTGLSAMTTGLPEVIVGAIKTRFAAIIDSKEALLAAVSLPKFKLRWVKDEARRDHIKVLLMSECRSLTTQEPAALMPDVPQPAAFASSEEDFFAFDLQPVTTADAPMSVETESAPVSKNKKNRTRCNAPTPSSAPVERLFSLGNLVLTPKRNRLGDGRFQRLLLMRFNRHFSQGGSGIGQPPTIEQ
ncbi:hypothetical protein F7725_018998 [Dissostichus mawsoni]|uniref:Transposase n=1 Tax=Dissostichus mawsoni TaxID=36200 RepID=A0A7J5XTS7_DISMA|nr:hypothetical protein F7725_018998 [Dissostichus mawsoni]